MKTTHTLKKEFLKFVYYNFRFSNEHCYKILKYFIESRKSRRLHFVQEYSEKFKNGIYIEMRDYGRDRFSFYAIVEGKETIFASFVYEKIKQNEDINVYINIQTNRIAMPHIYYLILEDFNSVSLTKKELEYVDKIYNELVNGFKIKSIKNKIDKALENKDFKTCKQLLAELNKLK